MSDSPASPAGYPPLELALKSGEERFVGEDGAGMDLCVRDFWAWAMSDLVNNTTRGALAEFLVAKALGVGTGPRADWTPFDLTTPDGVKVEVKSSGYVQSWFHRTLSRISFGIRATLAWDGNTNQWVGEPRIHADVYVVCLLAHTDKPTVDPLRLEQWRFYVLAADVIRERMVGRKGISLAEIHALGLQPVPYAELAEAVRAAAGKPVQQAETILRNP